MFHYKLRTLLIVLAFGPPVLALAWYTAIGPQPYTGFAVMATFFATLIAIISFWHVMVWKGD